MVESLLKKTKKRGILTENAEIVKYKDDGSAVFYPKLYTGKNMTIQTPFFRVATQSEVDKSLASKEKPIISVPATDYINTPIEVIAGIRIAGVFVNTTIEMIRLRVTDVIVFSKIEIESIFSEDLGITPIKDEDDASESI